MSSERLLVSSPHSSIAKVPLSRSPTPPSGLVVAPPAAFQTAAGAHAAPSADIDRRRYSYDSDLAPVPATTSNACSSSRPSSRPRRQQPRHLSSSEAGSVYRKSGNGGGGGAGCCDCHTRRRCRQISCVAVLVGTTSLSCLITAVMTDLWVHTVEPIATPKPPPHLMGLYEAAASVSLSSDSTPVDYRNPMAIDFDIGLWKVCPSVKEWIHSEYANEPAPVIACSNVRYLEWLSATRGSQGGGSSGRDGGGRGEVSWRSLGLWSEVECTTEFVDRMRLSTIFTILSLAIIFSACLFTLFGHCLKGGKMLVASGLYAFGGVVLGGSLIMFACFLVNECDVRAVAAASSGVGSGRLRSKYGQPASQPVATSYSYGWSFVLAVLAFLASEASAVLCFTAFIRRFDSEEDFVKSLPGMERRINEHIVSFHFPAVPDHCAAAAAGSSDFPGSGGGSLAAQSNQAAEMAAAEMSAIRSSFGHRVPAAADVFDTTAAAVPGRRHIVNSESFHSVVGITGIGTQFHAEMIPVTTREVVVQQRHHRRSMIVEAEESPAAFDDREQSSRGRQSMTLPRSLHQHPQQQYRPPQPPQDQLNSMKRSSFNHCAPPVSMVPPPPPPSQIPASSPNIPPPPPPSTTTTTVFNGSCVDSGLGGSDSSSFTFAEMHQVSAGDVGPLQHLMPNGGVKAKKSVTIGPALFTPVEDYTGESDAV